MLVGSTTETIINDVHAHILKQGGKRFDWYVGIANHTDRLFADHCVSRSGGWWIFRTAGSSNEARAIEKAFLDWGCDGGGGGGGYDTVIVYAYLKAAYTRP